MSRQARAQSSTGYYHVMMRGNNKENIFLKDNHKRYFLDCLKEQHEEGLIDIAAYCIMDNHAHIVAKSEPLINLSKAAKKINTKYAMGYNYRHDRTGHVFQSRYKSEIIYDDPYLLNVIRYVHINPIKAGVVREPGNYRWSSFNDYIKFNTVISNVQKQFILGFYNSM
ncbi:MAG TPA: transposase, partial [Firmicutes bacterium]|nr:transposase [Bacillota bacterium]